MGKGIPHKGVTTFLSTTITEKKPVLMKAIQNVVDVKKDFEAVKDGVNILGIHFEEPYLDMQYKGVQPQKQLCSLVRKSSKNTRTGHGLIRIITLA